MHLLSWDDFSDKRDEYNIKFLVVVLFCNQMLSKSIFRNLLVGFVDINEAAARARAEDYGVAGPTGTDLGKMLDAVTPDAVFDCTIPEVHTPVALQAFSRGCHVLSEKPMSDSMENAYKAARAASTSDRARVAFER